METRTGTQFYRLIRFWPWLAFVFFCLVLWLVSQRVPMLVRWELLRTNSAQMLSEERDYLERLTRLNQLPEDNRARLAAREALASVFASERRWDAAQDIYLDVLNIKSKHKLDATGTLLALGGLYRDMGKFDRAAFYYQDLWNFDKQHLDKADPRLVRDLNNLGVVYYLIAMATEDKLERELELNRSNFYLIQADIASGRRRERDPQDVANIWENRALVVREMGNIKEANNLKKRARVIHKEIPDRIDPP